MKSLLKIHLLIFLFLCPSKMNAQLQDILNSISSDSLMTTMKELTGALPIQINGKTDTIKTRLHLTTYNRRAQEWIQGRLQKYGIQTETIHYHSSSPAGFDVSYTNAVIYNNDYWFCTDWGEIFKASSFPTIESKNISGIPFEHRLDWIEFFGTDTIVSMGKTGYFLISNDGGETWRKDNTGLKPLVDFIRVEDIIIAAGYDGKIWHSSNKGSSWSMIQINDLFKINDLTVLSNNYIIAAGKESLSSTGAAYFSTNKGLSWSPISSTFSESVVSCTSVDQKCWFATINGKVYYSSTPDIWSMIYTPDSIVTAKKVFFSDSLHGWIMSNYNHLYKTTDKGYSWNYEAFFETPTVIENFIFTDSINGIVTGKHHYGITTTDGGESWQDQTIPLPFAVVGYIPGSSEPEKAILFAAHTDCIINLRNPWRTSGWEISHGADDDGSGTTTLLELARVFSQYPSLYTIAFAFVPTEELGQGGCAATSLVLDYVDTLLFGFDLDMIGYDSLNSNLLEIGYNNHPVAINVFYNLNSSLSNAGIPITTVPRPNITTINICLPDSYPTFFIMEAPIGNLVPNPNYHDITDTWNSLNYNFFTSVTKAVALMAYQFSTGELLSVDENSNYLDNYYLSNAYPNPFNSFCTIKYSIPRLSGVKLKIFNTLGEEIKTLVNEEKYSGNYSVEFNAASLPSGVYFYRLQAGNFVQTRKMILMK